MPSQWFTCCSVVALAVFCERHRFYRHCNGWSSPPVSNETDIGCDESVAWLQIRSVQHIGNRPVEKVVRQLPLLEYSLGRESWHIVLLAVVAAVFMCTCLFWTCTKELEEDPDSPRGSPRNRTKSGTVRPEFYGDAFHKAWSWKSTIAFCVSIFTVEGSLLFSVGSIFLLPGMTPTDYEHRYVVRGWVDFPYMIGAWLFTLGNYFMYLQVINKHVSHDGVEQIRFVAWMDFKDGGHLSSVLNVIGALFYNVNTMSMLGWPPKKTNLEYDVTYVGTGFIGSLCFIVAGLIQGEYNLWRRRCDAPVWVSYLNLLGGLLFLLGYVVDYDRRATARGTTFYVSWVVVPFLVGSLSFLLAAYIEILMWKKVQYGLGYARELRNTSLVAIVEKKQMMMIFIYLLNICMAWVRLCFVLAERLSFLHSLFLEIIEKVLAYHGILFCVASFHKVPDEHPFDYMIYIMRVIAVCGLLGEIEAFYTMVKTGRYP